MERDFPPVPDYPFPDSSRNENPDLKTAITEYMDAYQARSHALGEAGWDGRGDYFAGRTEVLFMRTANRITLDPNEAAERLGLFAEDGLVIPGYTVVRDKGELQIGYVGETDEKFFATMELMVEWGEELAEREANATIPDRAVHMVRRLGILK